MKMNDHRLAETILIDSYTIEGEISFHYSELKIRIILTYIPIPFASLNLKTHISSYVEKIQHLEALIL